MAKSALDMFTKCLSLELGPKGIRVNSIKSVLSQIYFQRNIFLFLKNLFNLFNCSPAVVKTNFDESMGLSKDVIEAKRAEKAKQYPIGRIGECEDIANSVAYLASSDASFITGISLIADGGFLNT